MVAGFHCEDALTCSHRGFSFFRQIEIREISAKLLTHLRRYTSKCLSSSHSHPLKRIATMSVHKCSRMKPGLVTERRAFWEERQEGTHLWLRNFNPPLTQQPRHLPKGWLHEAREKHLGVRESNDCACNFYSTRYLLHRTKASSNQRNCATESHPQSLPDSKHQLAYTTQSSHQSTGVNATYIVHMNECTVLCVCIDEFKCVQPRKDANAPKTRVSHMYVSHGRN